MSDRYYLKTDYADDWTEVDKATWIEVERKSGFRPKMSSNHPDYMMTCATGWFGGNGHSGKIEFEKADAQP